MGRQNHDGAFGRQRAQPIGDDTHRAVVEAGERLVEQHQPRTVQQRSFERQTLPHPARERADGIAGAIAQTRGFERFVNQSARIEPVELREERQVLPRGQLRIEMEFVCEQADARPQSGTEDARGLAAVANLAFRR